MSYLAEEYRLQPVDPATYRDQAARVATLKRGNPLDDTLRTVFAAEEAATLNKVYAYTVSLREAYGTGSGFYALSSAVGIAALREANPDVPPIGSEDWARVIGREAGLHHRLGVRTLEEVAGIGLLEVRGVNPGYVDGYEEVYGRPELIPHLGFTGLANLHAHDLMHFASLRA